MEVCPNCGALESGHTTATKRDVFGNVIRYRICAKCKTKLPSLLLIRPKKPSP